MREDPESIGRAAAACVPHPIRRRARLERELDALEGRLVAAHRRIYGPIEGRLRSAHSRAAEPARRGALAALDRRVEGAGRAWRRFVASLDLEPPNRFIRAYNRFYPTEADLPNDPRTGDILDHGSPFVPSAEKAHDEIPARWPPPSSLRSEGRTPRERRRSP